MAIKTNLKDLRPTREKFNRTIKLLGPHSVRQWFPKGEVTVYPWDSTIDEWVATTKDSKSSDYAQFLLEIVKRLVNLGDCPAQNLCYGDATLVMMVARSLRNKGQYSLEPKCSNPKCGCVNPTEYIRIPEDLEILGLKELDYPGYDEIKLPDSEDLVCIRPTTIGDVIRLANRNDLEKATVTETRAALLWNITSVGGGKPDSLDELNEWYNALSPSDQVYIGQTREKLEPQLSNRIKFECERCKEEFSVEIPLNSEFFRLGVPTKPEGQVEQGVSPGKKL